MRHKKILHVFTIFHKGRQQVGFVVENNEKYIYLSPANIKQNTGVEINEVEILIGSTIRPTFYGNGEKMFDGRICTIDNYVIKDFWITLSETIEELRVKNKDKVLPMKNIIRVFQFTKDNRNVTGFDTGDVKATFISSERLHKLTSLDPREFHILEGSFICPEYYKEGEQMGGTHGLIAKKSGVMLKNLNLRFSGNAEEMHKNFEERPNFHYSNSRNYNDRENRSSYNQYGGPSDGYGGSLDDDFINNVLDGDPSAIWNID